MQAYLKQLDLGIPRSTLDAEDRLVASQEDRPAEIPSLHHHRAETSPRPFVVLAHADVFARHSTSQPAMPPMLDA